MKIEIINEPMLCWDEDESKAVEYHVLAKVTQCDTLYPYKVVTNKNSGWPVLGGSDWGPFMNAKPLQEAVELTVAQVSKLLGKTVKIIE